MESVRRLEQFGPCTCNRCGLVATSSDLPADWIDLRIKSEAEKVGKGALLCGKCRVDLLAWIDPAWAKRTAEPALAPQPVSAFPLDLRKLEAEESAFCRGVCHALNLAGDLVRAGATADDLDILTDLAMDWRYHARPDVHVPEDLVRLWRAGEHGTTGIDLGVFQGSEGIQP